MFTAFIDCGVEIDMQEDQGSRSWSCKACVRGNVGLLLASLRMFEYYCRDPQESCGVFHVPSAVSAPEPPQTECPT
jgi:hypothetical protein